MTAINIKNYELFFLDHIEERLNEAQTADLILFLDAHPELKEELEGLEMLRLEPDEQIRFEAKDLLKTQAIVALEQVNEQSYEEFFVSAAEGNLTKDEIGSLNQFLTLNPSLQKEYNLIQQCHLQADKDIIYPDKDSLKKSIIIPFLTRRAYYGIAVAASLALLIGLTLLLEPVFDRPTEVVKTQALPVDRPLDEKPEIPVEPSEQKKPSAYTDAPTPISSPPAPLPSPRVEDKNQEIKKTFTRPNKLITLNQLASRPFSTKLYSQPMPKPSTELRLYFTNYFPDIAMAQHIRHAVEMTEKPLLEKLLAQSLAVAKEIFQPGEREILLLPEQIDFWQIADLGINSFARITGADLAFKKEKDDDGRVVAFAFESQLIQISRNLYINE